MNKTKVIIFISLTAYFILLNFLRNNYLCTTILDDAYIFFRYAENIFNGSGFVWNINEQSVEGYTSFLYLVILIIAEFASVDLELFVIILGTISSVLTIYFALLTYDHLYSKALANNWVTIVSVAILALSPAYIYWSPAGMETSFYSMFLILTFYLFLKLPDTIKTSVVKGILFGLLCIIRFEAVLFFLAGFYYLVKAENTLFKVRVNLKAMVFVLGFTIVFGTYFIWRWSYFGYFFPNTFYAKTGGGLQQVGGGFIYIFKALRLFYGFGWIPLIFVFLFFRKKMIANQAIFLFSIGLISLATTILIGGDHFHLGRFVLPVFPLLMVFLPPAIDKMLVAQIKYLSLKPIHRALFLIFIVEAFLIVKPVYQEALGGFKNLLDGTKETLEVYDKSAEEDIIEWQNGFIIMGKTLNKISSKNEYIAAVPIGAISYYSKMNVIDMVGLVDPIIAHEEFSPEYMPKWTPGHTKGNGKYILSRKPEYIQLTDYLTRRPLEKPHERSTQFISVKEIWESEEFHRNYEFYPIEVIDGWYYNLFRRKEI